MDLIVIMYTPFSLEQAFSNKIKKVTDVDTVMEITGFYYMSGKTLYTIPYRDSTGKFYFDELKDPESSHKVTILVSENKRALLKDGRTCKLRCLAYFKEGRNCKLQLTPIVEEVLELETAVDPEKVKASVRKSELISLFRNGNRQQNVSLELKNLIRKNQLPKIALIQPKVNDTLDDIYDMLGEHRDKYVFKDFRVNIRDEQEIIKTLNEADRKGGFNLIALFRGGGHELDDFGVFDTVAMGEAIVEIDTPFVIAIGHAGDDPFIQRVSDRAFSTPGDFGSYLKEIYLNSGREDYLIELENKLKESQIKLDLERSSLAREKEKLIENAKRLNDEKSRLAEKNNALDYLKKENIGLKTRIESVELEKGKKIHIAVSVLISSFVLVAATYFLIVFFFGTGKTTDSGSINSNSKTYSNAKNK